MTRVVFRSVARDSFAHCLQRVAVRHRRAAMSPDDGSSGLQDPLSALQAAPAEVGRRHGSSCAFPPAI